MSSDQSRANTPSQIRLVAAAAACSLLLLLLGSVIYPNVSGNPSSRFATIQSLVEGGTFVIDDSPFEAQTVDKITLEGHVYSSKPPVFPVIGAAVYGALHSITGWTFTSHPTLATTWVRLFLQMVPFALFLLYFWRFLGHWMRDPRARVWLFLTVALGSYLFGYSSKLNNHAPAAFLVFGAFYHAYLVRHVLDKPHWGHFVAAGLMSGLAITIDLGSGPLVGGVGIYLLLRAPLKTLLIFGPLALVPLVLNGWLNLQITGSPLPVYLQSGLYSGYWENPQSYDTLSEAKPLYVFHMVLGHHGWLVMSPTFFLAFGGLRNLWRRGNRAEVWLFCVSFLLIFIQYSRTNNYGGGCGGMRWLIVTAPFWILAVGVWLDDAIASRKARIWYVVFAVIGVLHALPMVWDPWTRSPWHRLFQVFGWGSV